MDNSPLFGSSEEADDDDDPEYNFVDDLDEPDQEDYRTDRAVQITSKFCLCSDPDVGQIQSLTLVVAL